MTIDTPDAAAFDRSARALHASAVAQVPARTLHQLRVRRTRTRAEALHAAPRVRGWAAATACAAVFAVAIGVRLAPQETALATMAVATSVPAAGVPTLADDPIDAIASFDEDPDFYLWLASRDAQLLALE